MELLADIRKRHAKNFSQLSGMPLEIIFSVYLPWIPVINHGQHSFEQFPSEFRLLTTLALQLTTLARQHEKLPALNIVEAYPFRSCSIRLIGNKI